MVAKNFENSSEWKKTVYSVERAKESPFYEESDAEAPHGYFEGRRIIGRDMPINKGVYLGAGAREAIVVDDEKFGQLEIVYQRLIDRQTKKLKGTGQDFKTGILPMVFGLTLEILRYDLPAVDAEINKYPPDHKIALDQFISKGFGICRHQALLAGYLIERLIRNGILQGKVSVDRNSIPSVGGHAWVRYTNSRDEVIILDPAQKYAGYLKDVPKDKWFYERPDDSKK